MKETAITTVARILNVKAANWKRVGKNRADALKNGFTDEDFIEAANNMAQADVRYQSIYSVFTRTDYWLNQKPKTQPKGVW